VILWKAGWEKHVTFLNPKECFDTEDAAVDHSMVFATDWCDRHFL
jgi:hypothetical protein